LFTFFQPIARKSVIMETAINNLDDETVLQPRDKSRESIFLGAVVHIGDEKQSRNVRVRNISSGGMMIDLPGPQPRGLLVVAEMKGIGEVRGQIVWSTENRAGIAFEKVVDPKLARHTPPPAPPMPTYSRPAMDQTRRPGLAIR
jgi:PilZ domain